MGVRLQVNRNEGNKIPITNYQFAIINKSQVGWFSDR